MVCIFIFHCVTVQAKNMCFPGGGTHVTRDMCFPGGGTHITRDMCFPGGGTHVTWDMCFPGGGTHVTRDICFPGGGTHITRNMCFPTWDLLLICIHSNDGKYFYVYLGMLTNLLLLLFLLGHHTSPELPGETASFCFGVLKNLLITYIHL